jgi:DNA replication protein DnaC
MWLGSKDPVRADRLLVQRLAVSELAQRVADNGWEEHFDLSDPECPVAVRPCRSCAAVVRFEFPMELGGVNLALFPLLRLVLCADCGRKEIEEEEKADREKMLRKLLGESGMPAALAREVSWKSIITKAGDPTDQAKREQALEVAQGWAKEKEPARGLWLWGPPGSGKTRLAATAAVSRLRRWPLQWVSVAVLIAQLEGAWNDDERRSALKILTSPGAIVLDDLDKVPPSQRVKTQLFAAIDKREQAGSTMIVTTNTAPAKLEPILGDVIVSRLVGRCVVLAYPGADMRLGLEDAAADA